MLWIHYASGPSQRPVVTPSMVGPEVPIESLESSIEADVESAGGCVAGSGQRGGMGSGEKIFHLQMVG